MKRTDNSNQHIILLIADWRIERLQNKLHLINKIDEHATNDIFEMMKWIKCNKELSCDDVWNISLSKEDKFNANAANLIYWLTGDDKIWKTDAVWKYEWKDVTAQFLEWFEHRIKRILKKCQTIGQLKNSLYEEIGSEDFYEFGLKYDLITHTHE